MGSSSQSTIVGIKPPMSMATCSWGRPNLSARDQSTELGWIAYDDIRSPFADKGERGRLKP
jgi:hypothetical protein